MIASLVDGWNDDAFASLSLDPLLTQLAVRILERTTTGVTATPVESKVRGNSSIVSLVVARHTNSRVVLGKVDIGFSHIFTASEHNHSAYEFHRIVDGTGPTVTLIETKNDTLLVGYASNSWDVNMMSVANPGGFIAFAVAVFSTRESSWPPEERCLAVDYSLVVNEAASLDSINQAGASVTGPCFYGDFDLEVVGEQVRIPMWRYACVRYSRAGGRALDLDLSGDLHVEYMLAYNSDKLSNSLFLVRDYRVYTVEMGDINWG